MAYTITKNPDGDVSLGNLNGEFVSLSDSVSDYATGGYAFVDGAQFNANSSLTINIDLWKIIAVIPVGGQSANDLVWNPTTKKIQIFPNNSTTEAANGADFSGFNFQLLVIGY